MSKFLLLALSLVLSLSAKPHGCTLVSGELLQFIQTPNELALQTNGRTILEWDSFSIASGEMVRFQQTAPVLNRVTGPESSQLFGQLLSNGHLYLINPHGVFIGPGGTIEAASYLASTHDLLNADFLNGHLHFSGDSTASIVNCGTISCPIGAITLLARHIETKGKLEAPDGSITLLSGTDILLSPDPHILIRTDDLTDLNNPYAKAVHPSGTLAAKHLVERDGKVYLSGTLTAHEVQAVAAELEAPDVLINASNNNCGGIIVLDGHNVTIGKETRLSADGNQHGGTVVCLADETMRCAAQISLCGENGGFAEVSGKYLDWRGRTDARGRSGKCGTLLLDPVDIVIGGSPTTGSFSACSDSNSAYVVDTGTATNQILNTDLSAQLELCNVTIDTGDAMSGGSGPNSGSITVSSLVTWSMPHTLTLIANRNIAITANITSTYDGVEDFMAMDFTANGVPDGTYIGLQVSGGAQATTQSGHVVMYGRGGSTGTGTGLQITGASSQVATNSGSITLTGIARVSSAGISLANNTVGSVTGDIWFTGATAGASIISVTTGAQNYGTGTVTFKDCGTVSLNTSTAGTFVFENCIAQNASGVTLQNQTITALQDIIVTNVVGGSNVTSRGWEGAGSTLNAGGNIVMQNISTIGGAIPIGFQTLNAGGIVNLQSDASCSSGTIMANSIAIQNVTATSSLLLQPSTLITESSLGILPVGTIQLNGTTVSAPTLLLAPSPRDAYPSVTTIFGNSDTENNIVFRCQSFVMGPQESMTGFGDIVIEALNTATVSDIVALGTLSIFAQVVAQSRPQISLLSWTGNLYPSPTVHLLSTNGPFFHYYNPPANVEIGILRATKEMLLFNPVLNFDSAVTEAFLNLSVANAQLAYSLPLIPRPSYWPYRPLFCQKGQCPEPLFEFRSFLFENRVWE